MAFVFAGELAFIAFMLLHSQSKIISHTCIKYSSAKLETIYTE